MRVYDLEKKLSRYTRDTPDYSIEISIHKDVEPVVLVNGTNYPLDKFKLLQSKLRDNNIYIYDIQINILD